MGEVLREMPKKCGDPESRVVKDSPSLAELGVSHSMSSRCQAIAEVRAQHNGRASPRANPPAQRPNTPSLRIDVKAVKPK